jgi:hypothetical protein
MPDLCPSTGRGVGLLGGNPAGTSPARLNHGAQIGRGGAVQVSQIDDPETALTDIWLTLQSRANGEDGQLTYEASREPLPLSKADSP